MATEKEARPRAPRRAGEPPPPERQKIPLPALPSAPARAGSPAAPSTRTGSIGASVMNDLVDEIERDLEKDLARHSIAPSLPVYSRVVGCWYTRR